LDCDARIELGRIYESAGHFAGMVIVLVFAKAGAAVADTCTVNK
jgi:hypothetical protein